MKSSLETIGNKMRSQVQELTQLCREGRNSELYSLMTGLEESLQDLTMVEV